jgi:uncharacterized protein YkwD
MRRIGHNKVLVGTMAGLLSVVIAVAAGLQQSPPASARSASGPCTDAEIESRLLSEWQMEQSIQCLINVERASRGLRSVRPNVQLRSAGAMHAAHMVQQGFFSHSCLDGTSFLDRIRRTGYMRRTRSWTVGENLAWGTGSRSTPQSLVAAWMGSPPHRANVLSGRYRDHGVAVVRGTPDRGNDQDGVTVSSEYGRRKCVKRS